MKICLLGHFPPHIGGVSSHTYLLSQELVKRGDEVFVLTYPSRNINNIDGVHVETAPTINIKGLRGFFFFLTATFKLIFLVKRQDIDLIHAHFLLPPGLIAVLAGLITRKKIAVTVHGSDIFILASNPVLRIIIKYILKRADYIAVVDQTIQKRILELKIGGIDHKIIITPNAVDIDKYNPQTVTNLAQEIGLNSIKPIILFVGNLVPQKGLKYIIEAKKLLKSDAELLIVGDGPLMVELKQTVKKDKISDVFFTGARQDVNRIMPAADVFVLPSVSEGFPITIIEALASGLPVVATHVGGIPDVVTEEVGIIVKPGDPPALAEALDLILENSEIRSKMKKAARSKAMEYSCLKIPY